MNRISSDPLDRSRYPVDEWALRETGFSPGIQGRTETLFTVGNGYLGMRGNMEEGRDGRTLRALVAPALCAAADASGTPIEAAALTPRLARLYQAEFPDLVDRGPAFPVGRRLRREPCPEP